MEASDASLDEGFAPWESAPPAVLGLCLRSGTRQDEHAAFSTCKAFAMALLSSAKKPRITVRRQASYQAFVAVLPWAAPCAASLELHLNSNPGGRRARHAQDPVTLRPLLDLLHQKGVSLPTVTSIICHDLVLDYCPPASLGVVFPNLQQLKAEACTIPPTLLPLADCASLRKLELSGYGFGARPPSFQTAWLPQLQQLQQLPTLSSLAISVHYPTAILPLLADQLTELDLFNGTSRDAPNSLACRRWEAVLAEAAQCTNVRNLKLSACTATQLGTLTTLTQLQDLSITDTSDTINDEDALITTLLRFPNLTTLYAYQLGHPCQSYADSPCTWTDLTVGKPTPLLVAQLPLHALTQPLKLHSLDLSHVGHHPAHFKAAADNLARSGQGQVRYGPTLDKDLHTFVIWFPPHHPFGHDVEAAARVSMLRAAAPLVPHNFTRLTLCKTAMSADTVMALQKVMPPNITHMSFRECSLEVSFWVQLARSFPSLQELTLSQPNMDHFAASVMGYYAAAIARHWHAGVGHAGVGHAAAPGRVPQV